MPLTDDEKIIINNGFMGSVFAAQETLGRCGGLASKALALTAEGKLSDDGKEHIVRAEKTMERALQQLEKAASITEQAMEQSLEMLNAD